MKPISAFVLCLLCANPLFAQDQPTDVITIIVDAQQVLLKQQEMEKWVQDYQKIQDWYDKWANRYKYIGKRKHFPPPPNWLEADCANLNQMDLVLADDGFGKKHFIFADPDVVTIEQDTFQVACVLLRNWQDDFATAKIRNEIMSARTKADKPTAKTKIWELVNFDTMYIATSWDSPIKAPLGMHLSIKVGKWLELFGSPGILLVCLNGYSACSPALDYGFGIRLFNFRMPGIDQPATLHFNMVKAWIIGGPIGGPQSGMDLGGFSITFRRKPK